MVYITKSWSAIKRRLYRECKKVNESHIFHMAVFYQPAGRPRKSTVRTATATLERATTSSFSASGILLATHCARPPMTSKNDRVLSVSRWSEPQTPMKRPNIRVTPLLPRASLTNEDRPCVLIAIRVRFRFQRYVRSGYDCEGSRTCDTAKKAVVKRSQIASR